MNTAVATSEVVSIPLSNRAAIQSNDPYKVRWGFNGVVREKFLNARETGIGILPFAKFFPITSFNTVKEFHTTDDTQPKESMVTIPAAAAELELVRNLAGQNETIKVPDLGLKIGFYDEEDTAKLAVINSTLPTLSQIRKICAENGWENPIGEYCPSEDEFDRDGRETCPSCWLEWLLSDAYAQYCTKVSKEGVPVKEFNPEIQQYSHRLVKVSVRDFETARDIMTDSVQTGLIALKRTWQGILKDVENEKGVQQDILEYQHGIRKDVHGIKPTDRQAVMVERSAQAFANANQANNAGLNDALTQLAVAQKQIAENQNITNQAILQLLNERKGR